MSAFNFKARLVGPEGLSLMERTVRLTDHRPHTHTPTEDVH